VPSVENCPLGLVGRRDAHRRDLTVRQEHQQIPTGLLQLFQEQHASIRPDRERELIRRPIEEPLRRLRAVRRLRVQIPMPPWLDANRIRAPSRLQRARMFDTALPP